MKHIKLGASLNKMKRIKKKPGVKHQAKVGKLKNRLEIQELKTKVNESKRQFRESTKRGQKKKKAHELALTSIKAAGMTPGIAIGSANLSEAMKHDSTKDAEAEIKFYESLEKLLSEGDK